MWLRIAATDYGECPLMEWSGRVPVQRAMETDLLRCTEVSRGMSQLGPRAVISAVISAAVLSVEFIVEADARDVVSEAGAKRDGFPCERPSDRRVIF